MNKGIAQLVALMALTDLKHPGTIGSGEDASTRQRAETCPVCGEKHHSTKSLCCSAKCYKELKKRQS